MKVGLITTHYAINYGAILQAYALQKKINETNYTCEIINLFVNDRIGGRVIRYNFSSLHESLKSIFIFFNINYRIFLKKKIFLFDSFLRKYCNLSKNVYRSYEDIRLKIPKYDYFVCGSDQLWNLNLLSSPAFFLRFEDIYPTSIYIAYAVSIAENLTKEQYSILCDNIKHFSVISIREKEDAEKLQRLINKKVECALDPVFLLSTYDWHEIMKPFGKIEEPYMLLYEIAGNKEYGAIVKKLKKQFKYKTVCINTRLYNKYHADYCINDASPENFIWLIKNAHIICTTSFHALAFSIIFNKVFIVVPDKKRSSRHTSILNELGIKGHLFFESDQFDAKNIAVIDYAQVNLRLNALKIKSLNYLQRALGL